MHVLHLESEKSENLVHVLHLVVDFVSVELRFLIHSSESRRLVTLGVCRLLDGVEGVMRGDLLKEGCEKTR